MQNLKLLLEYLKTVPGPLDMHVYGLTEAPLGEVVKMECRTAACALGYSCDVFEEFQLVSAHSGRAELQHWNGVRWEVTSHIGSAVREFYRLTRDEANYLFGPCSRTLDEQIEVMESFIRAKQT